MYLSRMKDASSGLGCPLGGRLKLAGRRASQYLYHTQQCMRRMHTRHGTCMRMQNACAQRLPMHPNQLHPDACKIGNNAVPRVLRRSTSLQLSSLTGSRSKAVRTCCPERCPSPCKIPPAAAAMCPGCRSAPAAWSWEAALGHAQGLSVFFRTLESTHLGYVNAQATVNTGARQAHEHTLQESSEGPM